METLGSPALLLLVPLPHHSAENRMEDEGTGEKGLEERCLRESRDLETKASTCTAKCALHYKALLPPSFYILSSRALHMGLGPSQRSQIRKKRGHLAPATSAKNPLVLHSWRRAITPAEPRVTLDSTEKSHASNLTRHVFSAYNVMRSSSVGHTQYSGSQRPSQMSPSQSHVLKLPQVLLGRNAQWSIIISEAKKRPFVGSDFQAPRISKDAYESLHTVPEIRHLEQTSS